VNGKNIRLEHVFKQQIYRGFKRAIYDQFEQYLVGIGRCVNAEGKLDLIQVKKEKRAVVSEFLEQYLNIPKGGLHKEVLPLAYDILTNNDLRLFNKQEQR
jgi:hypothetical protein